MKQRRGRKRSAPLQMKCGSSCDATRDRCSIAVTLAALVPADGTPTRDGDDLREPGRRGAPRGCCGAARGAAVRAEVEAEVAARAVGRRSDEAERPAFAGLSPYRGDRTRTCNPRFWSAARGTCTEARFAEP